MFLLTSDEILRKETAHNGLYCICDKRSITTPNLQHGKIQVPELRRRKIRRETILSLYRCTVRRDTLMATEAVTWDIDGNAARLALIAQTKE